jgi:hypothetical protein
MPGFVTAVVAGLWAVAAVVFVYVSVGCPMMYLWYGIEFEYTQWCGGSTRRECADKKPWPMARTVGHDLVVIYKVLAILLCFVGLLYALGTAVLYVSG